MNQWLLVHLSASHAAEHSARPRQMLEALLLRQLAGRRLLAGNIVGLPLFGQLALFVVECVLPAGNAAGTVQASEALPAGARWPAAVAATSRVSLLLGKEAPPGELQEGGAQEDMAAKAAALAAEALGCTLDDAGALAARHAAAAGMASRRIQFEELGGVARHVSCHACGLCPVSLVSGLMKCMLLNAHFAHLPSPAGGGLEAAGGAAAAISRSVLKVQHRATAWRAAVWPTRSASCASWLRCQTESALVARS